MLIARPPAYPGVAQFGSALEWGSRGREFDSRHSDQIAGLEIGRTPLNVTIERCFLCLYHFCAAACLGGFWHKVTDQYADWPPGVPAGASRIPPCKSPGWRALLRQGAGDPPAAPHPPAPVCGGADAKTKPAVHGGTGKKRRPPRCGRTGAVRKLREKSTNPAFLFYSLPPDFATVSCAETALGRGMFLPAGIFAWAAGREGGVPPPACPPVRGIFCCLTGAGVLQ